MRQYLEAKRQHRDAIVFFRMGDFYETFFEDALVASRALELTLTSRSKDAAGGEPGLQQSHGLHAQDMAGRSVPVEDIEDDVVVLLFRFAEKVAGIGNDDVA